MKVRNWEQIQEKEKRERTVFGKNSKIPKEAQSQNCTYKKRYENAHAAKKACRKMAEKYPEKTFRTYTCPVCRFYHVTSQV